MTGHAVAEEFHDDARPHRGGVRPQHGRGVDPTRARRTDAQEHVRLAVHLAPVDAAPADQRVRDRAPATGLVLFDTGQDRASVTDPDYFPGGLTGSRTTTGWPGSHIEPHETLSAGLRRLGHWTSPTSDRRCCPTCTRTTSAAFPSCRRRRSWSAPPEWRSLQRPLPEARGCCVRTSTCPGCGGGTDRAGSRWPIRRLAPFTAGHDLFGDGSLVLLPTPGHTPGSVSMLVRRPGQHPLLLVGDLTYDDRLLEAPQLPGVGEQAADAGGDAPGQRAAPAAPGPGRPAGPRPQRGLATWRPRSRRPRPQPFRFPRPLRRVERMHAVHPAEELRYLILAAQREGNRAFARRLRPLGLTPSQAEVLRLLDERQPLSLTGLGELLVCESGTNPSRLVDRLVTTGLVRRRRRRARPAQRRTLAHRRWTNRGRTCRRGRGGALPVHRRRAGRPRSLLHHRLPLGPRRRPPGRRRAQPPRRAARVTGGADPGAGLGRAGIGRLSHQPPRTDSTPVREPRAAPRRALPGPRGRRRRCHGGPRDTGRPPTGCGRSRRRISSSLSCALPPTCSTSAVSEARTA